MAFYETHENRISINEVYGTAKNHPGLQHFKKVWKLPHKFGICDAQRQKFLEGTASINQGEWHGKWSHVQGKSRIYSKVD